MPAIVAVRIAGLEHPRQLTAYLGLVSSEHPITHAIRRGAVERQQVGTDLAGGSQLWAPAATHASTVR